MSLVFWISLHGHTVNPWTWQVYQPWLSAICEGFCEFSLRKSRVSMEKRRRKRKKRGKKRSKTMRSRPQLGKSEIMALICFGEVAKLSRLTSPYGICWWTLGVKLHPYVHKFSITPQIECSSTKDVRWPFPSPSEAHLWAMPNCYLTSNHAAYDYGFSIPKKIQSTYIGIGWNHKLVRFNRFHSKKPGPYCVTRDRLTQAGSWEVMAYSFVLTSRFVRAGGRQPPPVSRTQELHVNHCPNASCITWKHESRIG